MASLLQRTTRTWSYSLEAPHRPHSSNLNISANPTSQMNNEKGFSERQLCHKSQAHPVVPPPPQL